MELSHHEYVQWELGEAICGLTTLPVGRCLHCIGRPSGPTFVDGGVIAPRWAVSPEPNVSEP
jgi:hypothetical protein